MKKFVIVGLGLIGGSMAMALKGFQDFEIIGVARRQATVDYANSHGVGDKATLDLASVLPQADVTMLCMDPDGIVAFLSELVADGIEKLSGERAAAHTGAVSLEYPVDIAYPVRRQAEAGACAGGYGVGRGYERIRPEIHVEHRSLRPFAEDGLASVEHLVYFILAVHDFKPPQIVEGIKPLLFRSERVLSVTGRPEHVKVAFLRSRIFGIEIIEDVANAESVARYFVGICRAYPLAGGADFGFSFRKFVGRVEMPVRGHYKVCLPGYPEYLRQVGALFLKSLGLLAEQYRIKHYPIAYEIDAIPENTGRDGTQHDLPAVKLKSVSGIGAALETRHHVIARGEHIHDLAFSFIAPLEA